MVVYRRDNGRECHVPLKSTQNLGISGEKTAQGFSDTEGQDGDWIKGIESESDLVGGWAV